MIGVKGSERLVSIMILCGYKMVEKGEVTWLKF